MNILITGATGFVGQHLYANQQWQQWGQSQTSFDSDPILRLAVRDAPESLPSNTVVVGNIGPDTDWSDALESIDIVIHLAGLAHLIGSSATNSYEQYHSVNSEGTRNLAIQAVKLHVKRFIYMSSVKVYGENIPSSMVLSESSETGRDCDAYGLSKLEAERQLINIANSSEMDFVIIRSPLVYGPRVTANFQSLIKLLKTRLPLPFANIDNRRSMIAVDNLAEVIQICCASEAAKNQVFLVSDDDDLSLKRLSEQIRKSLGIAPRLFKCPLFLLKIAAQILGKSKELGKLTNSFQLNTAKAKKLLNWKPRIKVEDTITETVNDYLEP